MEILLRALTDEEIIDEIKKHLDNSGFDSRKKVNAITVALLQRDYSTNEDFKGQIEKLANFIMENIPGEPSQSEGAVDTAIRLLNDTVLERQKAKVNS